MFIKDLAVKPQLIEIQIDDPEILENYGEAITFWMRDHLDINTYFDFYRFQSQEDKTDLIRVLKKIILTETGEQAIQEDEELPIEILLGALGKIGEQLGKSRTKLSKNPVGKQ